MQSEISLEASNILPYVLLLLRFSPVLLSNISLC